MKQRNLNGFQLERQVKRTVSWLVRKLPILVWIGMIVLMLALWHGLLTQEQSQVRQLLQAKSIGIEHEITAQIETRIQALEQMAQRWAIRGDTPKSEWEADAKAYVRDYGGYQAIEWVDSTFHVRWIVPLAGNEAAQNFYLCFEPRRCSALKTARARQEITVTHTIHLAQGGKGFLAYVPVFNTQEFDGFIVGVFRIKPLLNSILNKISLNGYALALLEDGEELYSYNAAIQQHQADWQQMRTIHLIKDVSWDLQIWPTPYLMQHVQSLLPKLVFIAGLLVACLVSLAIYFAQTAWLHAQEVERINRELVKEIRERQQAEAALIKLTEQEREKATQLKLALTELQKTQSQLVQNEKMVSLGQMVAGVAHEINNPVSFIYGNITPASEYAQDLLHLVKLYQQHYPQPIAEIAQQLEIIEPEFVAEDFPKLLASMKEGAARIRQIVIALRNFSRLDEAEHKEVDIHQGIDNTLLILRHRLKPQPKRPEIQIIKEYGQLPWVECYPGELNQVFMNILCNAIDAIDELAVTGRWSVDAENIPSSGQLKTDKTPRIWIHTDVLKDSSQHSEHHSIYSSTHIGHKPQSRIVICITDNGCGMTPQVQQQLFNPFFTTKPPGKGTGLGLSISYRIVVDRHGGLLTCHSTPGLGTKFAIELPLAR